MEHNAVQSQRVHDNFCPIILNFNEICKYVGSFHKARGELISIKDALMM